MSAAGSAAGQVVAQRAVLTACQVDPDNWRLRLLGAIAKGVVWGMAVGHIVKAGVLREATAGPTAAMRRLAAPL
jgi:hypothetical protein